MARCRAEIRTYNLPDDERMHYVLTKCILTRPLGLQDLCVLHICGTWPDSTDNTYTKTTWRSLSLVNIAFYSALAKLG